MADTIRVLLPVGLRPAFEDWLTAQARGLAPHRTQRNTWTVVHLTGFGTERRRDG